MTTEEATSFDSDRSVSERVVVHLRVLEVRREGGREGKEERVSHTYYHGGAREGGMKEVRKGD